MFLDFRDIYSLGKFKALYAAIIPGVFMFTVDSANLYCQEFISSYKGEFDDDKEFVSAVTIESGGQTQNDQSRENISSRVYTLTNVGAVLFGMNNIILTRMQCTDYTFRNKFRKTVYDMIR